MKQNQYIFVTGFSSKPDILNRDHSFLNSQQNGQQNLQTKRKQIDFVSRNKIIVKTQKKDYGKSDIYKQQNKNTQIIQKSRSNKLNQSVGFNDESKEYNSEIMKLSQSFDFKMMENKKILRRIVPNNEFPSRSRSSMGGSVDEQCENQQKFRKNILKYQQNKENQNNNQYEVNQSLQSVYIQQENQKQQSQHNPSYTFNNAEMKHDYNNSMQLDNLNNQDESNIQNGNSLSDILKDQCKKGNLHQDKYSSQKNQLVLSSNDIAKDDYFNQDDCSNDEKIKNKSLLEGQKKKYQEIRNIINQNLDISQIQSSDISLKSTQNQKTLRILRKQPNQQNNQIDINDKQKIAKSSQIIHIQPQSQYENVQTSSSSNFLNQIDNDQIQNTFSCSAITVNQKSTIDETIPVSNNKNDIIKLNDSTQNTMSFDTIFTNELDRKTCKRKEIISSDQQQILNLQPSQIKQNSQQQLSNQNDKQQYVFELYENFNQISSKQQQNQQQKNEILNSDTQKPQQKIINRNYDYQISIKKFPWMNDQQQIQHYTFNPSQNQYNQFLHQTNLEDKSNKSMSSTSKEQNKQNPVLFHNDKKNDVLGFQPQINGKSPFKQNQQIKIHDQVQNKDKKFSFHTNSLQINNMNSNQDITSIIDKMNTSNRRVKTEPSFSSENTINNHYMSFSIQKTINKKGEQISQSLQNSQKQPLFHHKKNSKNINSFLEEFNLDKVSVKPHQPYSKSKQNKQDYNYRTQSSFQFSQINQNQNFNLESYQKAQHAPNKIKCASSMGFNESNVKEQNQIQQNKTHYNIISHPPLISLAQTQDNFINRFNSSKNSHVTVHGNSMPVESQTQTRKSGGTGGQNMVFEFHEVKQQPFNQRSVSQQSNRQQNIFMNLNISERSQGSYSLSRNQQNQNNDHKIQNFQLASLNLAPQSCSSSQSNNSYSNSIFNQKMKKLNESIGVQSNMNILGDHNKLNIIKQVYTEIDEDTRIFDYSYLKIQELKQQNTLQKSTFLSNTSLFDFNNTSITSFNQNSQNQSIELKANNDLAKQCFHKLENTKSPKEINQVADQYLDYVRTRISQIKNQKKNTEIDLILLNSKLIQNIESSNTELKSKMPIHLNQQLENIYQQIKKNIFVFSCQ